MTPARLTRRQWLLRHALITACATGATRAQAAQADTHAPRLISLSGGMTEVVYRLGAERWLVATDTTSTYPAAAARTTKVGYLRQLSAEGVLSLRPSALLGTHEAGPPAVLAQLRQAGVPLLLVQASHDFTELRHKVQAVAQASGLQAQGRALLAELQGPWDAVLARIEAERQAHRASRKVLFVLAHGSTPMLAGAGTAAHAMLSLAGAHNALGSSPGYRPLTAEAVVQARPDIILTTTESVAAAGGLDRFWGHPGLAYTPAATRQALRQFDAMALLGFGPRLPEMLDTLHRGLA